MPRFSRALVTGAAGFIGSRVSRRLLEAGLEVIGLDDFSNSDESTVPPGVKFFRGSVTDPMIIRKAIDGVEVILHFAARIGTRASAVDFVGDGETNIIGTLNLLSQAVDAGVTRFIYPSSAAVYGAVGPGDRISEEYQLNPLAPYGVSKLAAEMYVSRICMANGIDFLVLRYFNVYGPGQKYGPYAGVITIFAQRVLNDKPPVLFGDGEQIRDLIHVDDVVNATVMAVESELSGEVLNIGTGKPCSINKLARLVITSLNSSLEPVHGSAIEEEIKYSLANPGRAKEILGFSARKNLDAGIHETITWIESTL